MELCSVLRVASIFFLTLRITVHTPLDIGQPFLPSPGLPYITPAKGILPIGRPYGVLLAVFTDRA